MALIHDPDYTQHDLALILGLLRYQDGICRCGWPKAIAWHSEMEGWFDGDDAGYVCHACTAAQPEPKDAKPRKPVVYYHRPETAYDLSKLPPFIPGKTTTSAA